MKNTFYLKKQAIITIPFDYRKLSNPKLTEIKTVYVFFPFRLHGRHYMAEILISMI